MSVTHVVLFKFADADEAQLCVEKLRGMVGNVPQLVDLQAGVNLVPSERAYDVGLVATFATLEDLEEYAVHPAHAPVVTWARERASSIVAVDFQP